MVPPGLRLTPTPPLPTPVVLRNRRLGVGRAGKPAGVHALDVLSNALGLFGLGGGIGGGRLLSQLAGVHDEKQELFDRADDTGPVPASWLFLAGPARLFEQKRQRAVLLAPRLRLLAHRARAGDERDQAH